MKSILKRDDSNAKKKDPGSFLNSRRLILNKNSSFAVRESYKTLRTNIHFFLQNKTCKRIGITSGTAGEGKSITLLNLAISVAEDGQKVLLIDADLRRPAMARLMVEKATPGLSNVLADLTTAEEAIRKEVYHPNLDVLFSGDVPPNPMELLGSNKMREFIEEVSKVYDYILVDTPPVNVVSDANIVANLLDGILLLVHRERACKDSVKHAVAKLALTGIRPLGYVLNGVPLEESRPYGYYD